MKTISQERLTVFISIFIILSFNAKLFEIVFSVHFFEYLFLIFSYLSLLTISLAIILLSICYRKTIKPLLIILLIVFSVFSYAVNNFELLFKQDIITKTINLNFINFKSSLYILVLGILPSYLLFKTELTEFSIKNIFRRRVKALLILFLCLILLVLSMSKLINFPLGHGNLLVGHLLNIPKVVIPVKNFIMRRDLDDKVALIKTKGSCAFCNLSQANFKAVDLNGIDLSYTLLTGADLRYANFSNSSLVGIDLKNKDLTGTILSYADLRGARLDGVDFSNTDLTGTIFTDVDFSKVDLKNINLSGAILKGVNLSNKDLTGTVLSFVNLIGSNLNRVDLSNKDLTGASLNGVDLSNKDLTGTILTFANLSGANLDGVDLSNKDLTGTIFTDVDFSKVDLKNINLSGAILKGVNLSNKDLTGTILTFADLSGANLDGVDLSNKDLTGANLSGVDLSNKDLTSTTLTFANLSGANLDGVDLSNKDLTGTFLNRVDLSNVNFSEAKIMEINKVEIIIKKPSVPKWPALNEIQNLNVTRYDLSGNVEYIATKEGFLFESKENESRLVLDLNNDTQFPFFVNSGAEDGLLGIASQNEMVYIAYTNKDLDGSYYLVVDEYSMNFNKVRNIIKIEGFESVHFGGNLVFDSLGKLYLSVGDGSKDDEAQNLNSLNGKILRLDISEPIKEPEIIAYGVRNPWGVSIDSKDRMFILQCGRYDVEAVYLLSDLYSGIPANLGWPVFEGSLKKKITSLSFDEVLSPIFEYRNRPGCATAGVYLDDIESFLFADFFGTIRLLKEQENNLWYLFHEDIKEKDPIWGFGLDKKTKKIFIAPNNRELEILVD